MINNLAFLMKLKRRVCFEEVGGGGGGGGGGVLFLG